MGPKRPSVETDDLFRARLDTQINLKHPLAVLAQHIDWAEIERTFGSHFASGRGRPALPSRLVAGLLYLQHTFNCSDDQVVNTWVENPYWQHFTGETYLQTEAPIDPSSLTRWRKRIGEEGVETMLMVSIAAAIQIGLIKKTSLNTVIADTTVMPKAIAHPTDSRLLERARKHLVKAAEESDIALRQNYNRVGPRLAAKVGRFAHAKQFKRMHKSLRSLKVRVGRVYRQVNQHQAQSEQACPELAQLLSRVGRLLAQKPKDKNKLYALHAPEVECISKGKARHPYEFGVKVSLATTLKEGLIVGMRSMPGNPYDGHTLAETIDQVSILSKTKPHTVIVDKGYRGVELDDGPRILRSGQKRGITKTLKAMIRRRSAIEPVIGHMKMDGRLGRNPLAGTLGDALHAVLCGVGHNMRMLLRKLRLFCACLWLRLRLEKSWQLHDDALAYALVA